MLASLTAAIALVLFFPTSSADSSSPYRLNVPRLLLPYTPKGAHHVTFTLEAQAGCYTWTSTHGDVASADQVPEEDPTKPHGCSSRAVVRSESLSPGFRSTTIIAREAVLGHELRCVVDVGSVDSIEIITVRREVYVDEAPVKMWIRALDKKGNRFSRLTGLAVEWTLSKAVEAQGLPEPQAIARFETFDESQYEGEELILQLERKGLRGDAVLLEGLSVGIVRVNARLLTHGKESVITATSDLLVVENLHLLPPVAYIIPAAYVDYSVMKMTLTSEQRITMPCDQYELRLTNTTVGRLHRANSRVTGLQLGSTLLQLAMPHMPLVSEHYRKDADLHVVLPAYIRINVDTGVWVLEVERLYIVTVSVFDKDNNPILVTDNMRLDTDVSNSFNVIYESANGSYFRVRAIKAGRTTIKSNLTGVQNLDTKEFVQLATPVHRSQPVEINDRIDLQPDLLALPWHPENMFHYSYPMKAIGGSGQYRWACPETSVARIDSQGVLTSTGRGVAHPKLTDAKNSLHFDVSTVHVIPPVDMKFVPSPVEAEVGKFIIIPLAVFGRVAGLESLIPFGRCHHLPLQWSFSESDVFDIDSSYETDFNAIPEAACVAVRVRALRAGFTELKAVYETNNLHLTANVIVAGYNPLKLVNPPEDALLALGSSWNYVFEGGPLPWILDPSRYYQTGEGAKSGDVAISAAGREGAELQLLRVVCQGFGHHTFKVHVGNDVSEKNLFPANSTASAAVICATPSKFELSPGVPEELTKTCPWFKERTGHFPVLYERQFRLLGLAYDRMGHQFYNFSSLDLKWTTDSADVVSYVGEPDHSQGKVVAHQSRLVKEPVKAKLTLSSGQYNKHVLQVENVAPQAPFASQLEASLKIQLCGSPHVDPSSVTVFNHPDNKMNIIISRGSGFFSVKEEFTGSIRPARLTLNSKTESQVEVLPQSGGMTAAFIRDRCLDVEPMHTSIRVLDGNAIELTVADMVMVGKHLVAAIRVLDTNGEAFELEQYKHMNLRPLLIGPFISALPAGTDRSPKTVLPLPDGMQRNSLLYVIEGLQEGDAQLLFNATLRSNRVITSEAAEIQVYSPLRIEPPVIRLVPTAHYQVRVTGGPRPQLGVTFRIADETIATCDASGVVTARVVGETTLTGHAQSSMDGSAILTEDTVRIIVVKMTGIKIFAPSTRVLSTTETSVYAKGLAGETPVVFGTANPPITFYWQHSDDSIFQLQSVYRRAAASLAADLPFSARLLARSAGDGSIRLRAECGASPACNPSGAVFNDQLRISVVEKLHIVRPVTVVNSSLLMRPRSSSSIITNRAGHCQVTYQLLSSCGKDCSSSVVSVSSDGVLTSGGLSGNAFVLITAHEHSSFNQTLVLQVEVKPMASVTIHSFTAARAVVGKRHALPLGLYARFSATLQDDLGRVIDASSTQFVYRLSRFDVAHLQHGADNGTFYLRAAKEGIAVLQVSAMGGQTSIEDFINVHVGIGILPADPVLHLGTKVCFTSHLTGENDEAGYWSSSHPSVLSIEPTTGLAHALSGGHSTITYLSGGTELALVEVTVTQVMSVSFNVPSTATITNAQNTAMSQLSVPVIFRTSLDSNDGSFSVFPGPTAGDQCSSKAVSRSGAVHTASQQVPFTCVLSSGDRYTEQPWVSSAFSVESVFDSKSGESLCRIKALGSSPVPTVWSQPLQLTVQVSDAFSSYSVESQPVDVNFIPAFTVNTDQFNVEDNQPPSHVVVRGTPNQLSSIKVTSSEPSLVTVDPAPSQIDDGRLVYRLSIADTASQFTTERKVTVDFVSSLTGQRQSVIVTYSPPSETPSPQVPALAAEVVPTVCTPPEPTPNSHAQTGETTAPSQHQKSSKLQFLADERNTPVIIIMAFFFTIMAIVLAAYCLSPATSSSSHMPSSPHHSPQRSGFAPAAGPQHTYTTPTNVPGTPGLRRSPGVSPFREYSPPPSSVRTSPYAQGLLSETLRH